MFEKASRLKLRFESPKGLLSVEDLWDLPLTSSPGKANLDDIARDLHSRIEKQPKVSFVTPADTSESRMRLVFALDIVVHVIEVRIAENKERADALARKEKKQKLMEVLDRKQNAALESMSAEDIQAMINSL